MSSGTVTVIVSPGRKGQSDINSMDEGRTATVPSYDPNRLPETLMVSVVEGTVIVLPNSTDTVSVAWATIEFWLGCTSPTDWA